MSQFKRFHNLDSNYIENFKYSSRIQSFINNNPQQSSKYNKKYTIPTQSLDISTTYDYLIDLTYTLNTDGSITFIGKINKRQFQIIGIDIMPNNPNYTVDYTYNSINGNCRCIIRSCWSTSYYRHSTS